MDIPQIAANSVRAYRWTIYLVLGLLLTGAGWLLIDHVFPGSGPSASSPPAPVNMPVLADPVPAPPKVITKIITRTVRVYPKQAKATLKLPKAVQADDAQQVIAASQLPADDHPRQVTTVLNTETGDSETFVTRKPLPWLAWEGRGDVSVYYGLKRGDTAPVWRLQTRYDAFAVKALHVGALATLDGDGGAFVGVGAHIAW